MDTKYAKILNGYSPIFSQFGQDIYASDDVVQQGYIVFGNRTNKKSILFILRKVVVI